MKKMKLKNNDFFLVTAHRSENVDNLESLKIIFECIKENFSKNIKTRIIYPMHPRTSSKLKNISVFKRY